MGEVIELVRDRGIKPRRPKGDLDAVIHQEDIEELVLLRRRAREAKLARNRKTGELLWLIQHGTPVEPGVHTAEAIEVSRPGYQVGAGSYFEVRVR